MSTTTTTNYKSLNQIIRDLAETLRPPERITVSEAAEKYVKINQPGAYVGDYHNSTAPYMAEPMDTFASREFWGMVFVGPAQSGKTQGLILNTIAYSVKVDPMDMMVVCPTMTAARDFSIRRIDRLHQHSPEIGKMLIPGDANDNKFDKHYTTGMLLSLSWPTPTELAGKPIGRVVLTDRDRMKDDIDGDGEPFDLAAKRTTTYGSYAMTVAESSPSRPITNLKWIAKTPHEAPPCAGILGLYNRGDRRRLYWPCPECSTYFEGLFTHLELGEDATGTNTEKTDNVRLRCPHCAALIHPDQRDTMLQEAVWLKDGQGIDKAGKVFGPAIRTGIASFWMRGVAASFISWKKLYELYLDAKDEYERSGSEDALTKFYNNDLAEPYVPASMYDMRSPETLKARAQNLGERVVPEGVRFLSAQIDVQKNMFVVQVHGVLPGKPFDVVIVDRFNIVKSHRTDDEGERLWVKPATYAEDWNLITEQVIKKEYPLADGSGRMMGIRFTCCDSGGSEGVTGMAYTYYRTLRDENMHRRFILTKGTGLPEAPRTRINYPDSGRKDKLSAARGDIPVLMLQSNIIKDMLNGRLDCMEPGKGMVLFPDWLSDNFYSELCAETRTSKGWENLGQERNESWDLLYMLLGLCASELLKVEHLDWDNAPGWAAPWDKNDMVRAAVAEARFTPQFDPADFARFGKVLG